MQMGTIEMMDKAGPLCAGEDFRLPHAEPLVCNSAGIADSIRDRILRNCCEQKVLRGRHFLPMSATTPVEDSTGVFAFAQTHRLSLQSIQPEVTFGTVSEPAHDVRCRNQTWHPTHGRFAVANLISAAREPNKTHGPTTGLSQRWDNKILTSCNADCCGA
jgi:hypothetical protein